jgi:hypothetical protein
MGGGSMNNEAAERLHATVGTQLESQLLDDYLAAERRVTALDVMLEFGQWLANTPSRIYDLQDTLDSGDGDDYRAFAERFLATILDEEAQR